MPVAASAEVAELYPSGTPVSGRVRTVVAELQRAWIDLVGGQVGAVASRDVGRSGVLRIGQALQRDQAVEGVSSGVVSRKEDAQVQVALHDLPVPSVDQQLRAVGVVPGARFDGRAHKPFGTSGLFVEIMPGIKGLLETDEHDLTRFTRGTLVRVVVDTARENSSRSGRASVRLALES